MHLMRRANTIKGVTALYLRPTGPVPLTVEPQLASWDRDGSAGQVRLSHFLDHAETLAKSAMTAADGPLAVDLTVGIPGHLPLTSGGRDLDNYLFPLAQRLGPERITAMFGRKVHGPSLLAVGPAESDRAMSAQFSARLVGSYLRKEWKTALRAQLGETRSPLPGTGPVGISFGITTGPGRNWANIWKPLIDSFGSILGEDPLRPFHPNDDRITDLALHHHVNPAIGHDVIITASWVSL